MKNCVRICIFSLTILFLFAGLVLADNSTSKIFLDFQGEKYTLNSNVFGATSLFRNFFGIYAKPLDLTQGINLYLFPDFKFIYTEWGDVWEEKMIASGTYTFQDGKIFLIYEYKNKYFQGQLTNNIFHVLDGQIEKENYVTGYISVLVNDEGLSKLRQQVHYLDYLQRRTELYDWQGICKHFINNKK